MEEKRETKLRRVDKSVGHEVRGLQQSGRETGD